MAKKQPTDGAQIEARVLVDSCWGAPNDVITVTKEEADAGVAAGELDPDPEAVAYAKSLGAAQPDNA